MKMDWTAFLVGGLSAIVVGVMYGIYTYKKYTRKIDKLFETSLDDFRRSIRR